MVEGVLGRFCGRFWLDQGAGLTSIPGMGMSILQVSFLIDNRLLFVSVNTVNVSIKGHRVMRRTRAARQLKTTVQLWMQ